ncbi:MAG TPA: hypothetical protein VLK24_00665 [Gaiellaceae bacterium]|nr:hypothetical protein [Gaiellaceae bacterium]
MSDDGAYQDEMGVFSRLNDRELERLLDGRQPNGDPQTDELALFVKQLEQTFRASPDAATQRKHLGAIMDAVAKAPPVAAATTVHRRRRGRSTGRLVLAAATLLGLFCGVAYGGAFPGPVQGAIADVAHNVGVSLPGAHHNKDDGAQNNTHDGQPSLPSVTTPAPSNGSVDPSTHANPQQHDGTQNQENEHSGSQQQQSGSGTGQSQQGDSGSSGSSGNGGTGGSGQGAHGDGGSGQSGGGGSQGGGQQQQGAGGSQGGGHQGDGNH